MLEYYYILNIVKEMDNQALQACVRLLSEAGWEIVSFPAEMAGQIMEALGWEPAADFKGIGL